MKTLVISYDEDPEDPEMWHWVCHLANGSVEMVDLDYESTVYEYRYENDLVKSAKPFPEDEDWKGRRVLKSVPHKDSTGDFRKYVKLEAFTVRKLEGSENSYEVIARENINRKWNLTTKTISPR